MAGEILFYGATVERSDDDTSYTSIPNVTSVALPEVAPEYIDVTSLDSTGSYREYIEGLFDAIDVTMEQGYSRAVMTQYEADKGTLLYYRITFKSPDGGTTTGDVIKFQGLRRGSPVTDDIGSNVGFSNTIRVSGAVTWTAGA